MIRSIISNDEAKFGDDIHEATRNLKYCLEQPLGLDLEQAYYDLMSKYGQLRDRAEVLESQRTEATNGSVWQEEV